MKVTSKIIAAATLILGASAFALPASADYGDFGQHVYTERSASRFAPEGLPAGKAAIRSNKRSNQDYALRSVFDRIDTKHKAY